ncbi:hypothetical protein HYV69_01030 [Candidatus Uhrbacteria bacterium]|nr:hypothetical protein [Candidatus Uhrbacteria bacterium]
MFNRIITFALVGFFVWASIASAGMTSTNYEIRWDTISTGGSDNSSSASYSLRDSSLIGPGGTASSSSYQVSNGYRAGIFDQIISFDLYIQNSSNERAITSISGTTVSMTSTAGLSANDYVAVVQDLGASQIVGFGKISSVGVGSIVLDSLTVGASSPVIDGTQDYLYQLNGSILTLENISSTTVGTGLIGFEVTIDNDNGYSIQILENTDLQNGAASLDDVADGAVTATAEEYGARSSDTTILTSTFDTADTAITSTAQDIVTKSTFAFDDRSFIILKAGTTTNTAALTYSNTTTFIASGNY